MVILTSYTSNTYKAQIRSSLAGGFKQLYTASCTMSEEHAAKAVVDKNYGAIAASKVRQIKDAAEIEEHCGDFFKDPQRKQVFSVWTFDPAAKASKPSTAPSTIIVAQVAKKPAAIDGKATVVPDIDLPTIRQALEAERDHLIEVERSFKHFELDRCLAMGLQVLKAHSVFAAAVPNATGRNQHSKEVASTVDETSEPTSFEGWLAKEVDWLPKANAYRYKRAVQGLGLTHDATPDELAAVLQAARAEAGDKPLSLTQLANRVPLTLTTSEDSNTPEDKAGEARTQVHDWISRWDRHEKAGGLEDADVPTLKQLDDFLSDTLARIRQRIKSAAPAAKARKPKAAKPAAKKAAKKKPKATKP